MKKGLGDLTLSFFRIFISLLILNFGHKNILKINFRVGPVLVQGGPLLVHSRVSSTVIFFYVGSRQPGGAGGPSPQNRTSNVCRVIFSTRINKPPTPKRIVNNITTTNWFCLLRFRRLLVSILFIY